MSVALSNWVESKYELCSGSNPLVSLSLALCDVLTPDTFSAGATGQIESLGSGATRAGEAGPAERGGGRGTSMTRSSGGSSLSGASSTTPQNGALPLPTPGQVAEVYQAPGAPHVRPPHCHAPALAPPARCPDTSATPTGSLWCPMGRGTAPQCPGTGGAPATSPGCRLSPHLETRGPLPWNLRTRGEAASGTARRTGWDGEAPCRRILGSRTTASRKRSISSCLVWTVGCRRRQALAAAALYLMLIPPSWPEVPPPRHGVPPLTQPRHPWMAAPGQPPRGWVAASQPTRRAIPRCCGSPPLNTRRRPARPCRRPPPRTGRGPGPLSVMKTLRT